MANLFGKNKLHEIAAAIDTESVKEYIAIVAEWHEDYHNGSLRKDKETSREQEYNHAFFKTILGYKEKPATPFSFEPKATTDMGQLPDAVISYTDSANSIRNIAAVVELKGAGIDLDRPQRRDGNMSPVQQGFKYKVQYSSVPFVIISNFWEFRLYHDNLLDYEVWTLDDLVNPDEDYILFKSWFALLRKESLTAAKGASKTETLLSDIRIEQENIGKKFYKVYKDARLNLLRDIYSQNDHIKTDIDMGIQKAQKIIDRVVFAAFAEDRGLLPDNTLQRVIKAADSSVYGGSLWNTLKGFFEAIDVGSDKLEIPNGYNGGLFKHDEVLNNLRISDEPLRKVVELGTYNYAEDLSVNILGHIFEQSVSDLEEIKNKVNESNSLEALAQSRRKKDGIFYTPDYIVRYIVDNSLGAYLREHEEKFKAEFGLKGNILDKTYEKRERQAYTKYQDFLQNVKVVDPACGSGAFLVYVFDYLLAENKRVGDILGMSLFSTDEYIRDILRNNIYGVDLNEESVEITKLSLWLKTAQKGKKLTSLDNNIKCGNSLIDDVVIAGEKAFNWQVEFARVFENGGFDVLVGNPPYGAKVSQSELNHILTKLNYQVLSRSLSDTYIAFYMHCIETTLKDDGILGFIAPNTWRLIASAEKFRNVLLNSDTYELISITQHKEKVFADATVDCDTVIIRRRKPLQLHKVNVRIMRKDLFESNNYVAARTLAEHHVINLALKIDDYALIAKIVEKSVPLGKVFDVKNGVKPYEVGKGTPPQTRQIVDEKPYTSITKIDDSFTPLIGGSSFHRYSLLWSNDFWIKYGNWLAAPRDSTIFDAPLKIIFRQTSDRIIGTIIGSGYVIRNNTHIVLPKDERRFNLHFALGVTNSKLGNYFYETINPEKGEALAEVKAFHIAELPVRNIPLNQQEEITTLVGDILETTANLRQQSSHFTALILSEYDIQKIPAKLNKWWTLDFVNFVNALKIKLTLSQKDELLQLFDKHRTELSILEAKIQSIDNQIDQLVYKLYDLTSEEVAIIEAH